MTDSTQPPIGLLRRLAGGAVTPEELEVVQAWLQRDGLAQPPAQALQWALRLPALEPRVARPLPRRRLVASLVRWGTPDLLAGVRGALPATLSYEVEGYRVELELLAGRGDRVAVVGQAEDSIWRSVRLYSAEGELLESTVDEAGMFAFPAMTAPREMVLLAEEVEVSLDLPEGARDA